MKIIILIPFYNEEKNLKKLISELNKVVENLSKYKVEYLFVNDGSIDNGSDIIREIKNHHENIQLIEFSKNFGKEIAITAGLDYCICDAVIIMDADLQHPVELIPELIAAWEEELQIVVTKRILTEKLGWVRRFFSYLFYEIMHYISDVNMEPNSTDFRLLSKTVVETFKEFREKNRVVRGIIDWMGFKRTMISFKAKERYQGSPTYNYRKLFKLALDSFTAFSLFPLRLAGYLGLVLFFIFSLLFVIMIFDKFYFQKLGFSPISFVIVFNSLLTSILMCCLGLIAFYIANIHTEVVNRPLYIIKKIN